MAADLSLVEVNSQTAPKTWPLLLAAVETADFIAVDLVGWINDLPCTRRE